MNLKKSKIENLERKYRLNLINSITGIKPANLIATKSEEGVENVAVISSVVHLGSHPAQLAFVLRPQVEKESDTFKNIKSTERYSINHIPENLIKKAHYTSAKLGSEESEFDRMNIEKEYVEDFFAPFVKESPIKIGMKLSSIIDLPNDCKFIIGNVEQLILADDLVNNLGQIDLQKSKSAGISGLNSYYSLSKLDTFPYVRTSEIPEFE
ncbi:flavin reductase family protein [Frigoriflavimonas asaccharolytica]|uniref:Flavin reductase (DIM6/NTAB) family NADH-FMN oxidoreductase RutF n=1 Tax=Frigoriflavimonas asaccharolytica TaxID=2735899 RepID=A0A8J8K4B9_9FLAO|nr:flavin reductase [Frigoriflavimonas asaccharolytica]NRS91530.1 flavin reductase (DIM6/NTAB) family NADH-FMN oxidoreductase RutF [Frigoriflavimonas asaccharolytica]